MKKVLFSIYIGLTSQLANAENLSFQNVWNEINSNSAAQQSSMLQADAISESSQRASKHWLPRLYLDAKAYQTNDSGNSFIGLLEQRSLLQSDFNPDTINHPDSHFYTRGALGIDLPLYEGGMKTSQVEVLKNSLNAQQNMTSQIQLEQYSQASLSYASIAIINQQKEKIVELGSQINRLIKGYQLGNKSNPVGYSGLLGMKSLSNKLTGLMKQYDAQVNSYYSILKEMGLKKEQWTPLVKSTVSFVDQFLLLNKISEAPKKSFKVQAQQNHFAASEEAANIEKAKFLPRVGAFAEGSLFNGHRDTANSYMAGVYLQWSLYDPSSFGSLKEARLKSQSIKKSAEALEQQERAERYSLLESIKASRENIELLNESDKILSEQSKITESLFKNGSINALQFLEILSRRSDLITQKGEAELALVKAASQVVTKESFEISKNLTEK